MKWSKVLHIGVAPREFVKRRTIEIASGKRPLQPGIFVRRAVAPEDGVSSFFEIEFWRKFKTYASVSHLV